METATKDNIFEQPPIRMKFDALPKAVQERLLERQRGSHDGFVFKTGSIVFSYVLLALSMLWVGLLFFLSNGYLWSGLKLGLFSLISFVACFFLLDSLYKLFRWFTARSKPCLLITPLYVIDIDSQNVSFWNLEQIVSVNAVRQPPTGGYEFTEINLVLENGSQRFVIRDLAEAEEIVERIGEYRKLFIEASVRNDTGYFDSNDDFLELKNRDLPTGKTVRIDNWARIPTLFASAILTAAVMFGAASLNNYYDDKISWNDAQISNRASSYRNYLQTHPRGRWAADASARLKELYDTAAQKYRASLNDGYDPQAVEAVLKVLQYAAETQNYRVKVLFERRNVIPADIIEQLKESQEVKRLISMDDTFSDANMQRREGDLLTVITEAFRQVIPDDILEISGDCPGECVNFLVAYTIDADSVYYDMRQEKVPEADRTYYPGIFIDWNFKVQIPDQTSAYNFKLTSNPAEQITYDSVALDDNKGVEEFAEVLNADKGNIYNSMATSAFADFKEILILNTGIGTAPAAAEKADSKDADRTATEKSKPRK